MCSLRFENNLLSSEGVRFASISKKTLISKLSFAFVSLALPLLQLCILYQTVLQKPSLTCILQRSVTETVYIFQRTATLYSQTSTAVFYRRPKEVYSLADVYNSNLQWIMVRLYSPTEGKIQDCSSTDSITVEMARVGTPRGLQFGFPYSPSTPQQLVCPEDVD
jgi:hypothetical protein